MYGIPFPAGCLQTTSPAMVDIPHAGDYAGSIIVHSHGNWWIYRSRVPQNRSTWCTLDTQTSLHTGDSGHPWLFARSRTLESNDKNIWKMLHDIKGRLIVYGRRTSDDRHHRDAAVHHHDGVHALKHGLGNNVSVPHRGYRGEAPVHRYAIQLKYPQGTSMLSHLQSENETQSHALLEKPYQGRSRGQLHLPRVVFCWFIET